MPHHHLASDVPTESIPVVPPAPVRIPAQRAGGWAPPAAPFDGYGRPEPATPAPRRRRRWPWVVLAVFAVLFVIAAVNSRGATTSAAATRPAAPAASAPQVSAPVAPQPTVAAAPAGPATGMADGTYEIGVDVAAGRYKTTGPDGSSVLPYCYWERSKDDSGELRSIIANDNLSGPGSVTVKKGEFVKLSGGCTWTKQ